MLLWLTALALDQVVQFGVLRRVEVRLLARARQRQQAHERAAFRLLLGLLGGFCLRGGSGGGGGLGDCLSAVFVD